MRGLRIRRSLLPALLATFAVVPSAHADSDIAAEAEPSNSRPEVSGHVVDPSGAVIPGAVIELVDSSGAAHTVTADASGSYAFVGLQPGDYALDVNAPGFAPQTIADVKIDGGRALSLDLKLQIETAQQNVEVTQDATDTSPHKNGDAIVIKGSDLDMLSTNSDQALQELQGIAGTGGDGSSPQLYVNGFSNGKMPPKNTIREIRINQNPFSAEYDDQGFNRIEIFTKPGSDKLHGEVIAFGTDSAFDSRNPFTIAPQPSHYFELDADSNGPLGKKTSFLVGILRRQLADSAIVNAEGLDANNNQVSINDAVDHPKDYTGFTGQLDRQVTPNNTFTAHVDYGHTSENNAGVQQLQLASQGYDSLSNFTTIQLSDTQVFGPKIINETRFQYMRTRSTQKPLSDALALVVQGSFTGGGSALGHITDNQDQYEFQNYATFDFGKHFIRAGIRQRFNREANSSTANFNGEYIFATLDAYQRTVQGLPGGGASQFNITIGKPSATVLIADTGLFAEDTWKISKKFTASYGLRFETQNHITDEHDFAPRVALTYNIGGTEKKPPLFVLQTGFGIFYKRFPLTNLLQAVRQNGTSQAQYVLNSPDTYPNIPPLSALIGQQQAAPTIYRISDTYHSPYSLASNVSLEHSFGPASSVTLGYSFARGDHQLLTRNVNAPLPGTYNPNDPTSGVRPFGVLQNIYEYDTQGVSNRNHIYINSHIRKGKFLTIFANYNFGYSRSDTSGSFPAFQYDVGADYGRDTADARHRLFLGDYFTLPLGISGGTFMIAQSGTPFDIVLGNDLNGDSQFNDRPAFATDLSRASVVKTRFGNFDTDPMAGQTIIPHNYAQGPGLLLLNTYWEKSFHFGPTLKPAADAPKPVLKPGQKAPPPAKKYTMTGAFEADNILNHVNASVPVGTLGSPLFGQSNALNQMFSQGSANRQIYFICSFSF